MPVWIQVVLWTWPVAGVISLFTAGLYYDIEGNEKQGARLLLLGLFFPIAAPIGLVMWTTKLLKVAFFNG